MPGDTTDNLTEAVENAVSNTEEVEETVEDAEGAAEQTEEETEENSEESAENEIEVSKAEFEILKKLKASGQHEAVLKLLNNESVTEKIQEKVAEQPKQTGKQLQRSASDIAKEILGDQIYTLPEKFVDVIEEILKERLKSVESSVVEVSQLAVNQAFETAYEKLVDKYPDYSEYEKEMEVLSKEIPMGNKTMYSYMDFLYKTAKGQKLVESGAKDSKRTARISANAKQPVEKSSAHSASLPKGRISIDDAVRMAMKKR